MNFVLATGRMVRDPVMRTSKKTGRQFCSMRFAITGDYKGADRPRDVDYMDMLAFGERGRAMHNRLRKGMRIIVLASIKVIKRTDAYGQQQETPTLMVKGYEMIDSRYTKEPIEDLSDASGNLLIPREITKDLVRQVDTRDEDMPAEFVERSLNDLFPD